VGPGSKGEAQEKGPPAGSLSIQRRPTNGQLSVRVFIVLVSAARQKSEK